LRSDGSLWENRESISSGEFNPQTGRLDGNRTVLNSYPNNGNNGYFEFPGMDFRWDSDRFYRIDRGTARLSNGTSNNVNWQGVAGIESNVYAYLETLASTFDDGLFLRKTTYTIIYSSCSVPASKNPPSPTPNLIYKGTASPPPPPGKKMCGCDCNTIATIIEERLAAQNKPIKDHIDQRTIEQLKAINKMLQGMTIDLDLQPVIDRINEVEANLWNGLGGNN
jgi:hypothetical protein